MTTSPNQSGGESGKHPDHFLTEWREYRGYTVRGLATAIGVSHSKIVRVENGDTELRPRFAKKLADFFRIPLPALFTVNPKADTQTAEMLDVWADIDPAKREDALRVLRALQTPKAG